jgi:hypothetical protein
VQGIANYVHMHCWQQAIVHVNRRMAALQWPSAGHGHKAWHHIGGGGFHGTSTLLQSFEAGMYNKVGYVLWVGCATLLRCMLDSH